MMTRMNDTEYAQAFAELEAATEINDALLEKLTMVANECDARGLEVAMDKRSRRGKSSDQGRRFVKLVNGLGDRFNCRLRRYKSGSKFEVRPAGSWR